MKFFVIAEVRFYSVEDGGLVSGMCSVNPETGERYTIGFPLEINGHYYESRFYDLPALVQRNVFVPVKLRFLSPNLVQPLIEPGKKFFIWHGRKIGEGVMQAIVHE